MNAADAQTLLAMAAAYDNRTASAIAARAWSKALNDVVNLADAEAVLVEHYARTRDWVMPSDINNGVTLIRRNRTSRIETPQPPETIDGDDVARQIEWVRAYTRHVGDGMDDDTAFSAACDSVGVRLPALESAPRPVGALVEQLARTTRIPRTTDTEGDAR